MLWAMAQADPRVMSVALSVQVFSSQLDLPVPGFLVKPVKLEMADRLEPTVPGKMALMETC